jgi:hypothetical protein
MKKYDEEAAGVLAEWTEKEYRAAVGARPRCEVTEVNEFNPRGPHRWFAESLADISAIIAMQQMAETWKVSPPFSSWRSCAAGIRQKADEMILAAQLLPEITLAQWYKENEPHLQQDPTNQERIRVVAVALLPVFENEPECWQATEWLDDDTHGTFAEYLADWHTSVPEKHRHFVRRIAREFGVEISGDK